MALPGRETEIRLGAGVRHALWDEVLARHPRASSVGLVVDPNVAPHGYVDHAPEGLRVIEVEVPAGEAAKTREVLAALQDAWIGLRRDEPVVAVGGGAVLDVAGFAAATVRRGLPWVAVATTVVAMADAAVGGKVAINHERGKNLLGTFNPPSLVLSDVDTLATLAERDRTAGLAELHKCGWVGDPALLEMLADGPPSDDETWAACLARAVAVKARIVEDDERDLGAASSSQLRPHDRPCARACPRQRAHASRRGGGHRDARGCPDGRGAGLDPPGGGRRAA